MRTIAIIIILAGGLGACASTGVGTEAAAPAAAAAGPPSAWKIDRRPDPITGGGANAWVLATRVTARPQHLPRPAGLQLACFNNQPVVRLRFGEKVGSNRSSSLSYRFDEKPGHVAPARFMANYATVVIEDRAAVGKFVNELAASDALVVSIDSHMIGKTNAAFPVRGAAEAIAAAYEQCPLASGKRQASAGR